MTNFARILTTLAFGLSLSATAQQPPLAHPAKHAPAKRVISPGERVFMANCSRCHNPPDTLNPRITGTVIRHMRVRANLSAADERDLLHFFNP